MPTKSTVRPSAVIAEEISIIEFHQPGKANLWNAHRILRQQESHHRAEYLHALSVCGSSPGQMCFVDVNGVISSPRMADFPRITQAIEILESSADFQEIALVLVPLTAELEAARASEEAARQAAAAEVNAAQAKLDAEVASATEEINKRGTLAAARNALENARAAFANLGKKSVTE